jgi:hypothetical protein
MTCQREPLPPDEEAGPEIDPQDPRRADKWVYTEADMDCIMPGLQAPRPDAEPTIDPHDPRRADKWGYTASEIFTVIPDLEAKLAQQGKLAPTVPLPRLPSSSGSIAPPSCATGRAGQSRPDARPTFGRDGANRSLWQNG